MKVNKANYMEVLFGKLIPESRDLLDPDKMAERRKITDARVEGWIMGQRSGFSRGLAWGIGGMVLFYSTVHALMGIFS